MAFDPAAPINRRTVTKGIAWSVPAVAVAGAAPAFAASPSNCVGAACVTLSGNVCKHPGEPKYYHFEVCFTNAGPAVTITFTEMIINGISRPTIPTSYNIPANAVNVCIIVDAGLYDNSANGASELKFTIGGTPGSAKGTFNGILPCGSGNPNTWRASQPDTLPPHV